MIHEVNLLPEDVKRACRAKRLKRLIALGAVFYFVLLAVLYLYQRTVIKEKEAVVRELTVERNSLAARSKEYSVLKARVQEMKRMEAELLKRLRLVQAIEADRISWSYVLKRLSLDMPRGVWLRSISTSDVAGSGAKKLRFIASATSNRAVADFVFTLENSPLFTDVSLTYSQKKDFDSTTVYDFEVYANLRGAGAGL